MSEEKEKQATPSLPHRENITSAQFNVLVGTFVQTANFLVAARNDEGRTGGPLDGGVVTSVETTVINLCARLDAMLADSARWSLEGHSDLEKSVREIYAQQARSLKAQADAYAEICTPHYKYKPQLIRMTDGSWLAYAGNAADLENAMCGVGDSPKMAIEAFDALFAGQVPENVAQWIEKNKSKIPNEQPKQNLDPERTGNPDKTEDKRPARPRHRRRFGPDGAEL